LLRKELKAAYSAISISFDLWTSLNGHAILSIVAHFINKDGKRRHIVLGLCEVVGKHTNKNIAAVLVALFRDYRIVGNIGFFIADNTKLNNTYINAVLRALYPKILAKKRKAC